MPQIVEVTSVNNIDMTATGQTPLFTVPAGKTLLLTNIYVFPTSVTGYVSQASFKIGLSPSYNEWINEVPVPNNMTQSNQWTDFGLEDISLVHQVFTGGDVITLDTTVAAVATTYTVNMRLFGFLY